MQQQQPITLEKKIGSGSFGDVFKGILRSTGEKIAVKRVKKKTLNKYGEYLKKAFWKEIESMKLCECENSIRLIQTMETENNLNIIMELCDTDLLIHLNKSPAPFTVDEVRDIFSQLNNAFKKMQENKIIHRDLKLGNILIKYTDETKKKFIPKLCGYGFSKELNNTILKLI
jgi:serine/threonine protein kinase